MPRTAIVLLALLAAGALLARADDAGTARAVRKLPLGISPVLWQISVPPDAVPTPGASRWARRSSATSGRR
jgi:hypothetical protein